MVQGLLILIVQVGYKGEKKMKDTRNSLFRPAFLTLLGVLITVPLMSCGFSVCLVGSCQFPVGEDAPLKELTSSDQNVVFEEPGTIIVYRGFGCAESNNSGKQDFLRVEQSLNLPAYATNATVFLNGWRARYLSKDHHVQGLGTVIGNIRLERNTLKWQAAGVLSDNNFDDAYRWCYHYTVVAWNPSNLNLTVDHKDGSCGDSGDPTQANFFSAYNDGATTALSSFPSFLQNPNFASDKTVAILPRGFGFDWEAGCNDHHLLQIGYNLDHSEIFIENGKKYKKNDQEVIPSLPNTASQVDSGFVSWETYGILKDNKGRRYYAFGEMVSGLAGNEVGIIQPPFSILPIEDNGNPSDSGGGAEAQEFVVENVPFEYAIPMLTGWELSYISNDEHVTETGIWIDEWGYDKNARTLRYKLSSILRDKDDDPGHISRHKVTILGIRPLAVVPDLVPFSPSGNSEAAFCRIEQAGTRLRVSVKNQGADADVSKTTVTFANGPVTLNTPAIPVGGSVDLLFNVPPGCSVLNCSFRVSVDSSNQINESNEINNSVSGACM